MFGLRRRKRKIFRYWNGSKKVGIDPVLALRGLNSHPKYTWDLLKDFDAPDIRIGDESSQIVVEAVRLVFGIEPWQETPFGTSGLTETETVEVLVEFMVFLDVLKKNSNGSQTWPDVTGQTPLGTNGSTTNVKSDSGSTANVSNSDTPGA